MALHRPYSTLVPNEGFLAAEASAAPRVHHNGPVAATKEAFPCPRVVADPQMDTPQSLGTTIMAIEYKDGVILAADTRTSTGTYVVNRATNKLTKLTDNVYCCRSGSAADTQAMAEKASHLLNMASMTNATPTTVKAAANVLQKMCYADRWSTQAGIIVAGWDPINGGSVYNIPLGGASIKHSYAIGGSGSVYLYGWFDQNFKSGMSKDEAIDFVRKAVAHAVARDGSSGGMVRTMCLSKNGAEHTSIPWKRTPYCLEKDPEYARLAEQNYKQESTSRNQGNVEDSSRM